MEHRITVLLDDDDIYRIQKGGELIFTEQEEFATIKLVIKRWTPEEADKLEQGEADAG